MAKRSDPDTWRTGPLEISIDYGERIARTLNLLPEVEWDRCAGDPAGYLYTFGWIPRGDGHRDFVAIDFRQGVVGIFSTSSAELSEVFDRRLWPERDAKGHQPCRRISEVITGVERLAPWQK